MGLLKYAVAGGLKGGADVYKDIAKHDRETQREQDIWDIRQKRLAEIRAGEAQTERDFRTSEREAGQEFRTSEREAGQEHQTSERQAKEKHERSLPIELGQKDLYELQDDGSYKKVVTGRADATTGGLKSSDILKQSNKYRTQAENLLKDTEWGMSEQSGAMVSRIQVIADKYWAQSGHDPRLASASFIKAHKQVLDDPKRDESEILNEIDAKEREWWTDEDDMKEIRALEEELTQSGRLKWDTTIEGAEAPKPTPVTPAPQQRKTINPDTAYQNMVNAGGDPAVAAQKVRELHPDWQPPTDKPAPPKQDNKMGVDTSMGRGEPSPKDEPTNVQDGQDPFKAGAESKLKKLKAQLQELTGQRGRSADAKRKRLKEQIAAQQRILGQ